jgi:hypothetical protein
VHARLVDLQQVSEATTQPFSSRPSTSGWMPCGSRAAYRAFSVMKTRQYAPVRRGSRSSAASWTDLPLYVPSSPLTSDVSLVESRLSLWGTGSVKSRSTSICSSSSVFVMLPLCASARLPFSSDRNVGCALFQVLEPVVE